MLGSIEAELGLSAHALERTKPRINCTPTIVRTTAKLERTPCDQVHLGVHNAVGAFLTA
jgi:hypothetical protein